MALEIWEHEGDYFVLSETEGPCLPAAVAHDPDVAEPWFSSGEVIPFDVPARVAELLTGDRA